MEQVVSSKALPESEESALDQYQQHEKSATLSTAGRRQLTCSSHHPNVESKGAPEPLHAPQFAILSYYRRFFPRPSFLASACCAGGCKEEMMRGTYALSVETIITKPGGRASFSQLTFSLLLDFFVSARTDVFDS